MSKPKHQNRGFKATANTPIPAQASQPPQQSKLQVQATQWSGPLPPPDELAKFNVIIPDGAERILRMAEAEQQHRINIEHDGQAAEIRHDRRGQYFGAAAIALAIIAALVSVPLSHIGQYRVPS